MNTRLRPIVLGICLLTLASMSSSGLALAGPACPGTIRSIVLGGGGTKGAYQAGAVWYLVNVAGCDFRYFYGTSTGAVSAALLSQASNENELRALVTELVENYKALEGRSDLVETRYFGMLRLLWPVGLGGTEGVYSLKPLEDKLRKQINPARIKGLTILSVSLQSGVVYAMIGPEFRDTRPRMTPYDPIDFIVGSASLPLMVEPRKVRFWIDSSVSELTGDTIVVRSLYPGLRDPECQIRFERSWITSCSQESTRPEPDGIFPGRWITVLKLPTLSSSEKDKLRASLAKSRGKPTDLDNPNLRAEFTAYHQIVDGGVVENVPIRTAAEEGRLMPLQGEKMADAIFVLLGAEPRSETDTNEAFVGGRQILTNALDQLWDSYQAASVQGAIDHELNDVYVADARDWIITALEWRSELEKKLGKKGLRHIETTMENKFPSGQPLVLDVPVSLFQYLHPPQIFLLAPQTTIFQGTFDVRKDAIRKALYHGCAVAAAVLRDKVEESKNLFVTPQVVQDEPRCDPLLK